MYRVILVLLTAFCGTPLWAADQVQTQPLQIVTTHVPPYFTYADDGSSSGIGADLLTAASRECGIPIKLNNHTWARALRHAEMGHADAIAPLAKTEERAKIYMYSARPIFILDMAVFTLRKDKKTLSPDLRELYGKTIGTIRNAYISKAFEKARKRRLFKLEAREEYAAMALSLSRNRLDAFVGDRKMGEYGIRLHGLEGDISASDQSLYIMPVYLAYSKKAGREDLYQKFDQCLMAYGQSQTTPE